PYLLPKYPPFCLPFIYGLGVNALGDKSNFIRIIVAATFLIFSICSLWYISWIFNDVSYDSLSIRISFLSIMVIFVGINFLIMKSVAVSD
ncbi:hypothetical protein ACFLZ4_01705, partial [Patescibacteria group bacterium]